MLSKQAMERSNKLFEGFTIINAIISSKDRLVLITKNTGGKNADLKNDAELKTKFILYNPKHNKEKLGINSKYWGQGIENAWGGFVGGENRPTVFCALDANVCEFTSDEEWVRNTGWEKLPVSHIESPMIRSFLGCINIDNDIYIFGALRKLYRRIGKQEWQDLTDETEHPNLHADLVKLLKQKKGLSSG